MIARRPEVQALESGYLSERQQWVQVYSLARFLGVSASLTRRALMLYQVGATVAMARVA